VLVVHPSLPVTTLAEFIQYARTHDTLVFASSGNGTSQHLSAEMFRMATGVKYQHVPYKGAAPATNDLLGGHVHLMFDKLPAAAPNIRAGKLRALAVTSARRNAAFPDLPAIAETVPGFDVRSWFGLMGPAGMPRPVVDGYAAAVRSAMASPEAHAAIVGQGLSVLDIGPDAAPAFFQSELHKHQKLVKQSGATLD